eukprot:9475638-Pyramimonas_sp.AAC.1
MVPAQPPHPILNASPFQLHQRYLLAPVLRHPLPPRALRLSAHAGRSCVLCSEQRPPLPTPEQCRRRSWTQRSRQIVRQGIAVLLRFH